MFDLFKNTLLSFKLKKSLKALQNQKKKKITSFKSLLIIVYENDLDEDFFLSFTKNLKISTFRHHAKTFASVQLFLKRIDEHNEAISGYVLT